MSRHLPPIVLALCIATFALIWTSTAQAKQQCSAAIPSDQHGYWSWRLIDGRKCWYEGKPMLSKSLLEWPAQTSARADSGSGTASPAAKKAGDPLNAEARAPAPSHTFEALWRERIEQR